MENLIISGGLLVYIVVSDYFHRRERTKLLNRIMATSYQEFNYYEKKYENDLAELESIRRTTKKVRNKQVGEMVDAVTPQDEIDEDTMRFMTGLEEDWNPEELDAEKLKKIIEKE